MAIAAGTCSIRHGAHVAGGVAESGTKNAAEVCFAGKAQARGYVGYAQVAVYRVGEGLKSTLQPLLLHVARHPADRLEYLIEPMA